MLQFPGEAINSGQLTHDQFDKDASQPHNSSRPHLSKSSSGKSKLRTETYVLAVFVEIFYFFAVLAMVHGQRQHFVTFCLLFRVIDGVQTLRLRSESLWTRHTAVILVHTPKMWYAHRRPKSRWISSSIFLVVPSIRKDFYHQRRLCSFRSLCMQSTLSGQIYSCN